MEIIIHYPDSHSALEELKKHTATIHADLIADYIKQLPYTLEDKILILQTIYEMCVKNQV